MRNDPFILLGVAASATKGELASAFAQARTRGIQTAEARKAFDSLRDPVTAEAMSVLAISLTKGYASVMSAADQDDRVAAAELVLGVAASSLADLEVHLASGDVMPQHAVTRDVRDYVPAPMEQLEP